MCYMITCDIHAYMYTDLFLDSTTAVEMGVTITCRDHRKRNTQ